MKVGSSPKVLSTKCRVEYRKSSWKVHEFEVWSGEMVCRAAVLWMERSVLVWAGGQPARLGELALGVPRAGGALATPLLGDTGDAAGLARRLAAALARPALVCCGQGFDRFSAPLMEQGIAAEIKSHPEYF